MGIGVDAFGGVGDSNFGESVDGAAEGGLAVAIFVNCERFRQLCADFHEGIERSHRILEDHGDALAANGAELVFVDFQEIQAAKHGFARVNAPGRLRDQAEQRVTSDGFSRARLADDSKSLPGIDLERNILHGMHRAVASVESCREVLDVEERHGDAVDSAKCCGKCKEQDLTGDETLEGLGNRRMRRRGG